MAANRRISDSMRTSMPANLATWALQLALAIYLGVFSALPMLRGDAYVTETFDRIGFGDWFRHLTGLIELAGAVGLLIPLLCGLAALGLTAVMIGAIVAEFAVRSPGGAVVPAVLLVLFAFVAWYRWPHTLAFADRVRR
ncbi:MAG: DoxX family protein [Thermocrispum agreste]|uniref:DoxX family protein n=2 Tax=Pseudonocardiaceae TaxID=2070 RepID=A0A2W4JES3_9PSEU|nr:MAG: DoxX family protein [Thermocrispum agreste]